MKSRRRTIDTLLVACGGGGLIGGIAGWYQGRVRIIGVEPELCPTLYRALEAGRPVDTESSGIAADSLAPEERGAVDVSGRAEVGGARGARPR